MFIVKKSSSYMWPVVYEYPSESKPGVSDKATFDAEFKRLTQTRIEELLNSSRDGGGDVAFAKEVLTGWKGIESDGAEMPFSEAARDTLLDSSLGLSSAIVRSYLESITGAKRKN